MSEVTSSSSTSTALLPNATAASAAAAITATSIASIDSQPEVQVKSNVNSGSMGVLGPPCRINDLGEIISGSTAHPIIEASRETPLRPSSAPFDPYFASATTASPSNSFSVPLRKGKWTPEEEAFTTCIINDFTKGFLPLAPGTTLRSYLSEKLNCDPMRITKKFAGASCIGKQVFQPCERTPENLQQMKESHQQLVSAERLFNSRVENSKAARKLSSGGSVHIVADLRFEEQRSSSAPSYASPSAKHAVGGERGSSWFNSIAVAARGRERDTRDATTSISDHDAGGLLIDFFQAVQRRATRDDDKMSTTSASDSEDGDMKRRKKRALSMPNFAGHLRDCLDEPRPKRTRSLNDLRHAYGGGEASSVSESLSSRSSDDGDDRAPRERHQRLQEPAEPWCEADGSTSSRPVQIAAASQ